MQRPCDRNAFRKLKINTKYHCCWGTVNDQNGEIGYRKGLQRLVQLVSSVTQLCPTLCNPMNRSTPGLPVHHQLPEFTETHVHRVSDAIQPSHPLSSPSPPAPNLSSIRVFSSELTLRVRWPKFGQPLMSIELMLKNPTFELKERFK